MEVHRIEIRPEGVWVYTHGQPIVKFEPAELVLIIEKILTINEVVEKLTENI